jgi:hypothetical protein
MSKVIGPPRCIESEGDEHEISCLCPLFASSSETCSKPPGNDTEWEGDLSDDDYQTIDTPGVIEDSIILMGRIFLKLVTKPVLSKMKQELVDRIMVEFWQIFNQGMGTNMYVSHSEQLYYQNTKLTVT